MEEWQTQHTCQALCRKLGLKDAVITLGERELTPPLVVFASSVQSGFLPPKRATVDRNRSR
ncbi:hypothetical protein K443DRAFT_103386, partial [Laccaria amethystina LaAM-08-1]